MRGAWGETRGEGSKERRCFIVGTAHLARGRKWTRIFVEVGSCLGALGNDEKCWANKNFIDKPLHFFVHVGACTEYFGRRRRFFLPFSKVADTGKRYDLLVGIVHRWGVWETDGKKEAKRFETRKFRRKVFRDAETIWGQKSKVEEKKKEWKLARSSSFGGRR